MTREAKTPKPPPAAGPNAAGRRFLAQLMEHAFREGWRTPDDFVKHFPAHVIMGALRSATELRVTILAAATGIYEPILRRKSPALAAEDLRIALDEGTTTSQKLLSVFSAEDRVRHLDPHQIWDFLAEDRFWELDAEASEELRQGSIERMAFTLGTAIHERLITLRDILDALTYDAVADSLSPSELRTVVRHALVKGRDGIVLNEKVLLEVLPLDKLVRSVPLDRIWNDVVIRRLAVPNGLTELPREERRASQAEKRAASERQWSSRPPALPDVAQQSLTSDQAVTAVPPSAASAAGAPPYPYADEYQDEATGAAQYRVDEYAEDDVLTAAPPPVADVGRDGSLLPPPPPMPLSSPAVDQLGDPVTDVHQPLAAMPQQPPALDPQLDASERQRPRVTEHLRAIGRLPPRHAQMPAAVLRSIDAMYALLPSATDDIQRKSVIRQAFASESHLRMALLGLIELMDSSVDTTDPVIQEAKIEALIKILLFEEQRRKETGRFPSGPFGAQGYSSSLPPSSINDGMPPSSGRYGQLEAPEGYYYPPPASSPMGSSGAFPASARVSGEYAPASVSAAPHVPTQRPPPPVLSAVPAYPGAPAPLPNLPADPASSRRRTVPPPLPPSYPRE